jgi:hypothetical protein
MKKAEVWAVIVLVVSVGIVALAQDAKPTAEDQLELRLVILQTQLAQALASAAKCEAEGPAASKIATAANAAATALVKSLDGRGLVIDPQTSTIVPKPPAATGPAQK